MKYRKKPVVVEAFQMTKEHFNDNSNWPEWLHRAWNLGRYEPGAFYPDLGDTLKIHTLEGHHVVGVGDWIVKGIKDELYPVKPDIFELTYEMIE